MSVGLVIMKSHIQLQSHHRELIVPEKLFLIICLYHQALGSKQAHHTVAPVRSFTHLWPRSQTQMTPHDLKKFATTKMTKSWSICNIFHVHNKPHRVFLSTEFPNFGNVLSGKYRRRIFSQQLDVVCDQNCPENNSTEINTRYRYQVYS